MLLAGLESKTMRRIHFCYISWREMSHKCFRIFVLAILTCFKVMGAEAKIGVRSIDLTSREEGIIEL